MKKTTKQLIVLMLILGVGCILEGCGKESNHSVTITLIHAWGGTEEDHVAMREIYEEFQEENPDINLQMISMPTREDMMRKVEDMIMVGNIPDIVSFSGDKLLGGPQAGILAGRKDLIEKISRHPLMRALRIDKFTAAALDKTVSIYLDEGQLEKEIPVYDMMSRSAEELKRNALWLMGELLADASEYEFAVTSTRNPVGGGTTPGKTLPGAALQIRSLNGKGLSAQEISDCLRKMDTPVIGHIVDDWVYLEMRTIRTGEELEILRKELKYDLYKKNPQ